jgi:hypothetical protein
VGREKQLFGQYTINKPWLARPRRDVTVGSGFVVSNIPHYAIIGQFKDGQSVLFGGYMMVLACVSQIFA